MRVDLGTRDRPDPGKSPVRDRSIARHASVTIHPRAQKSGQNRAVNPGGDAKTYPQAFTPKRLHANELRAHDDDLSRDCYLK